MKQIPGHPGYGVDRDGAVWSNRKSIGGQWRRLKPAVKKGGYRFVNIRREDGSPHTAVVHRLVLLAYVGEPLPHQTQTRHLDGNPANNRLSNLKWGTPAENSADMRRHGTRCTKIKPETVREVRMLRDAGLSIRAIAINLPIGKTEVHRIVRGEHWAWVE